MWDVAPPPGAGYCTSWHLPAGPWLASLRVAALPAACVAASLPQLAAVAQLQSLSMRQFGALPDEAQRGVLQWAGAHPALGRLCLGSYPRVQLGPRAFAALLAAQLRKPGLAIEPGSGLFQEPDAD